MTIVFLAVMILAADRVTKEIALRRPGLGAQRRGVVRVVLTERALLAHPTSLRAEVVLWFTAVAFAVCALLLAPALQRNVVAAAGIAAALAGAFGNLADRFIHGAVVDFVDLGWWPVFNLADMAIVGGVALAGASLI